jgi:CO dehydrogenase maturation factor
LLGQLEGKAEVVVADFEAGLGTMSRMSPGQVDILLVVVEPTAKSIAVAQRAIELIEDRNLGRVVVVANRVRTEEDQAAIARALPGRTLISVPDDPAVRAADEAGHAPFDAAADGAAVRTLRQLAESLAA